jgi:hypothetical protein
MRAVKKREGKHRERAAAAVGTMRGVAVRGQATRRAVRQTVGTMRTSVWCVAEAVTCCCVMAAHVWCIWAVWG